MSKLTSAVRNFVRSEEGATTAEYGIIVVVMAAIALAVLLTFRTSINTLYNDANTTITNATNIS
jgi:Flp pilus assembly pilin Flp